MRKSAGGKAYPVLPLRTTLIYPKCIGTIQINRRRSLNLLLDNKESSDEFILALLKRPSSDDDSRPDSFCDIVVAARIIQETKLSSDIISVTFEGLHRMRLGRFVMEEPYFVAYADDVDESCDVKIPRQAFIEIIKSLKEITLQDHSYSPELLNIAEKSINDPSYFSDSIASHLHLPLLTRQRILESLDVAERLTVLKQAIDDELKQNEIQSELDSKVSQSIQRNKREIYLREQLKQIYKELGEDDPNERLIKHLKDQVTGSAHIPTYVKDRLNLEIERLKLLSVASAEYGATKNYIELVLELPWSKYTQDEANLKKIEETIDREYYGPRRIKDRILEYLVIRKLTAEIRSPILCLAGPPGTGKSSLAAAIAQALGRKLININAAGLSIVEELKGDMRNFPGAVPGRIMRALAEKQSANPVVVIDDLDKMSMYSSNMSLPLAMLEVLDPKQNKSYIDTYVGIPFDFSKAIFITTVESLDEVPPPLTERMEVIEFTGYIDSEKIEIGQKFIIPKIRKAHKLTEKQLTFTVGALRKIIRNYTLESGLINFKREIELICRKASRMLATQKNKKNVKITERNLESFLGPQIYIPELVETSSEIGIANGLAWTGSGGDIMLIEGIKMRGGGNVIYTGSLGDVMKESIQASHSYVRAKADMLGIDYDDFVNYDIHIHFPSGAIPKDGPSAGVTISTVIASLMSDRPIASDTALTGEVSLRGKVLQVSGVKEKIAAAHRAGIFKVILPRDNQKDIKEMPPQILEDMEFIFVESLDEVFAHALLDFEPQETGLEAMLKQEIEKLKNEDNKPRRERMVAKRKKKKDNRRRKK
ncbi:MAG: endopeptidase La [candidate division Zixibacteria bacterium]|nr:endopeptidase La [candidate division Zixibacteria bacterium]NIR66630.1 endopeptidase La [candidate division Zixibacteria bacterium]NIS14761.1 endopeptidase La [candidate division Zixibacteria bacterium]NIS48190.1 endopeptidase La [candidate division Zixibacteria bacterium]NIT51303.1 endopeptidase La [candidate division Zixibacteria bacterium]